jgi:hypothetical protein
MKFRFLVHIGEDGRPMLCEGGVYTDDDVLRNSSEDYPENTLEKLERDVVEMNAMTSGGYEARDFIEISLTDWDVISSLAPWQKAAFRVYLKDGGPA